MKIVIAGAGAIGFHLAQLLSSQKQDITLIDINQEVLDFAQSHIDVITIKGDSSSLNTLMSAEAQRASLFLAVTTSEKNNLISAILAKKMGAKQTIARINNAEYLREDQRKNFEELGVDTLISPQLLAAKEIIRLVGQSTVTDLFDFEGGKISVLGITVEEDSKILHCRLDEVKSPRKGCFFKPIAVLRGTTTVIPRPDLEVRRNDHIYFIAEKGSVSDLLQVVGKESTKVRNIMILGGTDLGIRSAQLLEHEYNVTIVEKDKEACKHLVEVLDNSLIVKGDPSNIDLLKEEGLQNMDAVIALTPNSETNIITSLLAEQHGVKKTIALVENTEYTHISQNIGVDTLINKKLIAANNIFRFVRKGVVEAITSLHGTDGELIEFVVHKENRLTKKPISELHFPKSALVGAVIRNGESIIPNGQLTFEKGDKVIVFALPEAIQKVEQLFR